MIATQGCVVGGASAALQADVVLVITGGVLVYALGSHLARLGWRHREVQLSAAAAVVAFSLSMSLGAGVPRGLLARAVPALPLDPAALPPLTPGEPRWDWQRDAASAVGGVGDAGDAPGSAVAAVAAMLGPSLAVGALAGLLLLPALRYARTALLLREAAGAGSGGGAAARLASSSSASLAVAAGLLVPLGVLAVWTGGGTGLMAQGQAQGDALLSPDAWFSLRVVATSLLAAVQLAALRSLLAAHLLVEPRARAADALLVAARQAWKDGSDGSGGSGLPLPVHDIEALRVRTATTGLVALVSAPAAALHLASLPLALLLLAAAAARLQQADEGVGVGGEAGQDGALLGCSSADSVLGGACYAVRAAAGAVGLRMPLYAANTAVAAPMGGAGVEGTLTNVFGGLHMLLLGGPGGTRACLSTLGLHSRVCSGCSGRPCCACACTRPLRWPTGSTSRPHPPAHSPPPARLPPLLLLPLLLLPLLPPPPLRRFARAPLLLPLLLPLSSSLAAAIAAVLPRPVLARLPLLLPLLACATAELRLGGPLARVAAAVATAAEGADPGLLRALACKVLVPAAAGLLRSSLSTGSLRLEASPARSAVSTRLEVGNLACIAVAASAAVRNVAGV